MIIANILIGVEKPGLNSTPFNSHTNEHAHTLLHTHIITRVDKTIKCIKYFTANSTTSPPALRTRLIKSKLK